MLDYGFIEILETLTRGELKSFRRFICSPYFNRSQKVVKLFDHISKHHPNYEHSSITKESLHKKVSPGLPYNEITMRRLLFDLQNLAEKFLQQLNFENKPIEARTFMTEEIVKRGSSRMLLKNIKTADKLIGEVGYVNSDICLSKFRMETDKFYFGMIHNNINKKSFVDTEAGKLISGITYLMSYFMLEAIKHNDTLLTYSRSFNVKHNEKVVSQFLELFDFDRLAVFMNQNSMTGSYIIEVYLNALKSFLYFSDDSYYKVFKNSLVKHYSKLSPTDNHFLFGKLSGYCTLKTMFSTKLDVVYDYELFEIHKLIIREKYYETEANKYFPVDLFRNILFQATKLQEFSWLEDFIEGYSTQLHPNRRNDVINYSYAHLYFERNAYDESLTYLSRIKMDEFSYGLDAKNLYLKIYYDQGDYDSAFSFARSYLKYLNENPMVSESRREGNINFVKYTTKLINYHNEKSKTDLSSLALQITKCKNLTNRFWLAGVTESLEKAERKTAV